MVGQKGKSLAPLMVTLCFVGLGNGYILMNGNAPKYVDLVMAHVCLNSLLTFLILLLHTLLSQDRLSSYRKATNMLCKLIVTSLLIGSTTAWQIPSLRSLKLSENFGPSKGEAGKIECTGDRCEAEIDLSGKLLMKTGHSLHFKLKDRETGVFIDGKLYIKDSTTILGYYPDIYMPSYDLVHGHFFDNNKDDQYDKWTNKLKDNDPVRSKLKIGSSKVFKISETDRQTYPTYVDERRLGNLADKFKCGKFLGNDVKMKQVYSIHAHEDTGYVQYKSTDESALNITICLSIDGESCITTFVKSDEEISFDLDTFKLLVENKVRPRKPSSPSLLSWFDLNPDGKLDFDSWAIAPYDIRGVTTYGSIGALQSSCLYTKDSFCGFANFRLQDRVDWTLSDWRECSPQKEDRIEHKTQNGVITTLLISLLLVGGAIGGGIGGAYVESTCHHCSVKQWGILGPNAQVQYAKSFNPIDRWYPNINKRLPFKSEILTKEGMKYATDMFVELDDFEDSRLDLKATGRNIEIMIPEEKGEVVNWRITKCVINLAGGVSTCHYRVDYNGPDGERHVYSKDKSVVILTDEVQVKQGVSEGQLGVETVSKGEHISEICIGRVRNDNCAKVESIESVVGNKVVNMIDEEDSSDSGKNPDSWNFKKFWESLTEIWQKAVVIITWIIGIVCALIIMVVVWKFIKNAIMLSGLSKSANAFEYTIKPVEIRLDNETKNVSIKIQGNLGLNEKETVEKYFPTDILYNYCTVRNNADKEGIVDKIKDIYGKEHTPSYTDRRAIITTQKVALNIDGKNIEYVNVYDDEPISKFMPKTLRCSAPQTFCDDDKEAYFSEWDRNLKGTSCDGKIFATQISWAGCVQKVPITERYGPYKSNRATTFVGPACVSDTDKIPESGITCVSTIKDNNDDCNVEGVYRCGQIEDDGGGIYQYYWEAPVWAKDLDGTTADLFGMDCDERKFDKKFMTTLTKTNPDWYKSLVVVDHIDKFDTLVARTMALGTSTIEPLTKHTDIETSKIYAMTFYPWFSERISSIVFLLRVVDPPKSGLGYDDRTWVDSAMKLFKLSCRSLKDAKVTVFGNNTLVQIIGNGCEFTRPDNNALVRVQISKLVNEQEAMVMGSDQVVEADSQGILIDNCYCYTDTHAMCMRNDSIAIIREQCRETIAVDGSKLWIYDGGYNIGEKEAVLIYDTDKIITQHNFVYTQTHNKKIKLVPSGETFTDDGLILQLVPDGYVAYKFMQSEGRDCSGAKVIKCWEEDYKGVFWLSVGVPLGLIILILLLSIIKCLMSSAIKRRMKSGINYIDRSATSIVNIPKSDTKPTGNAMADFFRRRKR
jgi:hypothetical protein